MMTVRILKHSRTSMTTRLILPKSLLWSIFNVALRVVDRVLAPHKNFTAAATTWSLLDKSRIGGYYQFKRGCGRSNC